MFYFAALYHDDTGRFELSYRNYYCYRQYFRCFLHSFLMVFGYIQQENLGIWPICFLRNENNKVQLAPVTRFWHTYCLSIRCYPQVRMTEPTY